MGYTSDLTHTEWQLINYRFPKLSKRGRPREHSFRELFNAIFPVVKTGCQLRDLPQDEFSPSETRLTFFHRVQWEAESSF